jgi:hypothetical protein
VRGPKRAAVRRLIQGMVATCAAAALLAPAAGASVLTATHPLDVTEPTPITYTAGNGEANSLTLTLGSDGASLSFAEALALIDPDPGTVGGLDITDDCNASGATTAACQSIASTTVNLGDGNDTLKLGTNLPPLTIDGGTGTDRLDFSPWTTPVSINLATGGTTNMAVRAVENVTGGTAGDTITGGAGANTLRGGNGDDALTAGADGDTLVGGHGVDTITGGAGDDNITAADGEADKITCGAGDDSVTADPGDTFAVIADCEEIMISGASASDPVPTTTDPVVTTSDTSVIFVPALGSIVPVLAPGKADIADLIPPRAAMRSASRHRIPTVIKRGVPVRVTCQESCGISVALSVDRTTAKRLKLDARTSPVVIGTASATRTLAGSSVLRVKLTKKAKAAFKASKRSIVANTQVLVSDASGNGTLLQRHITLVR